MDFNFKSKILKFYNEWMHESAIHVEKLPVSGSGREYFRFFLKGQRTVLGVCNNLIEENRAYISFSKTFKKMDIRIPEIHMISSDESCYFVEDIGDESLYTEVLACQGEISDRVVLLYKKALKELVKMQVLANAEINYSYCYPVDKFDELAIQWDLNYFKYNFLKLSGNEFNELDLEHDFNTLKHFLLKIPANYFMFRDFQSRNILIKDEEPVFIDFQGGRKGPLTYDVASLLYQAKARLPETLRKELFDYYYQELTQFIDVDYDDLKQGFKSFALLRTLQVLGAYGFRGYFEKKPHFIESIPFAIENLKYLILNEKLPVELPALTQITRALVLPKMLYKASNGKLTVSITSFSYRKGIPTDPTENGGGFVFDCRAIHNPGRYKEFQHLTGKDQAVIDFFEREDEMDLFLKNVFALVDRSVKVYLERNFKHLMVNFGCTGGQHRSVYSAEQLKKYLEDKYSVNINLWHREQD